MNYRLVVKLLGMICFLIGLSMLLCLPWAWPQLGIHTDPISEDLEQQFETRGFLSLLGSTVVCFLIAGILYRSGKKARGRIFLREAMAIVGLSWVLATVLGALPFVFSKTYRGCSVRLSDDQTVLVSKFNWNLFDEWRPTKLSDAEFAVVSMLAEPPSDQFPRRAQGLTSKQLSRLTGLPESRVVEVLEQLQSHDLFAPCLLTPSSPQAPFPANGKYRLQWVRMGIIDSLFESQSGFSTTGATVIGHLEEPELVPHCILFWRSITHFLGGLGIIVLFVVVLGEGSAGKALMRNEVPGPLDSNPTTRMRHAAMLFTGMYCGLNLLLAVILLTSGQMNLFDAVTHSFATMATGGFSNYDSSLGNFESAYIQYVIILFMIFAGTNFTLLYLFFRGRPKAMLSDYEWRTYLGIILTVTFLVIIFGWWRQDIGFESISEATRNGLFQVVSIVTTTGFGTNDFDQWNHFGRGILLLLMFVGGCAGSTGGGMKVIRHILFVKILRREVEKSFRPRVVRNLQMGDRSIEDNSITNGILVYFALILILFTAGWLYVVAFEPDDTWGARADNKLIDSASAVAATLNNIGPGLGTVGASQNYGHFTGGTKFLFIWLMMLGRLELFVILVLFVPRFWRGYH